MFLAALNHDIDHRGTNNQFQKNASTVLANYYSTSTMERHHFNHAVMIMRAPGHNMFHSLSTEDYKRCLKFLEQSIPVPDDDASDCKSSKATARAYPVAAVPLLMLEWTTPAADDAVPDAV